MELRLKKVFTNGCFDVLHIGHIELLKFCRSIGDIVVVGINSDRSVRSLKGEKRPFNNQNERKAILESLKFVDEVHIFDEETPINLITQIKPDVIVKGGDYKPEEVVGKEISEVIIFETVDGYSTTKKIKDFTNR